MFEKVLHFRLISSNPTIKELIEHTEPLEHFTHEVQQGLPQEEAQISEDDVVFLDPEHLPKLDSLRRYTRKGTEFIFIVPGNTRPTEEMWHQADDIWTDGEGGLELSSRWRHKLRTFALRRERDLNNIMLQSVIDASPSLIWFKDAEGAHLEINDSFCTAVGKTKEQIRGKGHSYIWDLSPAEYAQGEFVCMETDLGVMESRKRGVFMETVKSKQGMRKFKTWKAPLFDDKDQVMGTVGIAHDYTDFLNLSEEMQMLLDCMPFATITFDLEGKVKNINSSFMRYFGIDKEKALSLTHEQIMTLLFANGWQVGEDNADEIHLSAPGGQTVWLKIDKKQLNDVFACPLGTIAIFNDTTAEHEVARQLKLQAQTDPLTGLFNRRYFFEHAAKLRKEGSTDAILYIDLNNFKHLNDVYGHDIGDDALRKVAEIIREVFGDEQVIPTRIGGDEFIVFIAGRKLPELEQTSRRFVAKVQEDFSKMDKMRDLSVSAGLSYTEDHNFRLHALSKQADDAMYVTKRRRSGLEIYSPALKASLGEN